jgi:hypothetical protein
METLLNSDISRPQHRAHRVPALRSRNCSDSVGRRKQRSTAPREVAFTIDDQLELIEMRYQALRARMILEELFAEGL